MNEHVAQLIDYIANMDVDSLLSTPIVEIDREAKRLSEIYSTEEIHLELHIIDLNEYVARDLTVGCKTRAT